MAGGEAKSFAGAVTLTRDSDGTFFDAAAILQTAITDVARFDHIPATRVRLGLLGEAERINLCLDSEGIGAGFWGGANKSVTLNDTLSPNGLTNGAKFEDSGLGGSGNVNTVQAFTVSTSVQYTFSVYAKKDQLNFVLLRTLDFTTPTNPNGKIWFDLNNGTIGTVGSGIDGSNIEDVGNGWFRCSFRFTTDGTDTTGKIQIQLADADLDETVNFDGTSSIFLWGAQFEVGAFPSSYIKVTTTAVTRKTDTVKLVTAGGLPHPGYNTVEGTYVVGFNPVGWSTSTILSVTDGTANDRMQVNFGSNGAVTIFVKVGNVEQVNLSVSGTFAVGSFHKVAFRYKLNDYAACVNGGSVVTDTSATVPPVDRVYLGSINGSSREIHARFQGADYYPTALTDSELVALST